MAIFPDERRSREKRILKFPASLAAYERAFGDLQRMLDERSVGARSRYNVELVFEEIVGNIIRHGCVREPGCAIEVALEFDPAAVTLTFHDNGPPFDPDDHEMHDLSESIADARVGGLGLLLVRHASTRIDYERTPQQKNRLVVTIAA